MLIIVASITFLCEITKYKKYKYYLNFMFICIKIKIIDITKSEWNNRPDNGHFINLKTQKYF